MGFAGRVGDEALFDKLDHRGAQGSHDFLRAGVRPATPLICQFITEHRERFGVVPICRALASLGVPIAPRIYHAQVAQAPSKRALWDMTVTELLAGFYEPDQRGRRPPALDLAGAENYVRSDP